MIAEEIPLGRLVCVTGVSGSGKSTMVNELLHPAPEHKLGMKVPFPTGLGDLKGIKAIVIDQSPIGRTPRSYPATYTGAFDPIRQVFAATVEAKARGYQLGQFSFNVRVRLVLGGSVRSSSWRCCAAVVPWHFDAKARHVALLRQKVH